MGNIDKRTEDRTAHVSIINYTYPSVQTGIYSMIHRFSKKINSPSNKNSFKNFVNVIDDVIAPRKNTAVTFDLSNSGLGICTTKPMGPGQKLLIFNSKWKESPITATVRWCKKHTDIFYRVGVLYS